MSQRLNAGAETAEGGAGGAARHLRDLFEAQPAPEAGNDDLALLERQSLQRRDRHPGVEALDLGLDEPADGARDDRLAPLPAPLFLDDVTA